MARVNILKQVKTPSGWRNLALKRDARGRIKWSSTTGRYIIEWRENGRRLRSAAGVTPSEAQEAQKRKRLELEGMRADDGLGTARSRNARSAPASANRTSARPQIKYAG